MQNPDLMTQLMDTPMMQQLMNNPELMQQLMANNPQMQQLIERNPELAHVLNDPQMIRQSFQVFSFLSLSPLHVSRSSVYCFRLLCKGVCLLFDSFLWGERKRVCEHRESHLVCPFVAQMARNPELMREMMRNTDRAMANISNIPGGFDALRRFLFFSFFFFSILPAVFLLRLFLSALLPTCTRFSFVPPFYFFTRSLFVALLSYVCKISAVVLFLFTFSPHLIVP